MRFGWSSSLRIGNQFTGNQKTSVREIGSQRSSSSSQSIDMVQFLYYCHCHCTTPMHTHLMMICGKMPLTDNGQAESQTNLRFRRDLALVDPAVLLLHVTNLQLPIMRALNVLRLEALVVGVRHYADCEDVQVSFPDP